MSRSSTRTAKSATPKAALALLAALAVLGSSALAVFAAGKIKDGKDASAEATLNAGKVFQLGGNLTSPLVLGGPGQPVNVTVTNPNAQTLVVSELRAAVTRTSKPACGATSFDVVQTTATVTIPPRSTRTLDQLGAAKPRVRWLNRPTVEQSACLGAQLALSYTGKGTLR